MGRERKSIQVGVMDIMRAITISLTLASLLLVGLLSPSLAQPTAILGRKEDVMLLVLGFEISLALIIGFVVLRRDGRRKIFAVTQQPSEAPHSDPMSMTGTDALHQTPLNHGQHDFHLG
jgi:hypothetical protein